MEENIRLQKFLAEEGIASRRKCEEFIKQGKVKVNGETYIYVDYHKTCKDIILLDNEFIGKEFEILECSENVIISGDIYTDGIDVTVLSKSPMYGYATLKFKS